VQPVHGSGESVPVEPDQPVRVPKPKGGFKPLFTPVTGNDAAPARQRKIPPPRCPGRAESSRRSRIGR
jgi:hypothetical protein